MQAFLRVTNPPRPSGLVGQGPVEMCNPTLKPIHVGGFVGVPALFAAGIHAVGVVVGVDVVLIPAMVLSLLLLLLLLLLFQMLLLRSCLAQMAKVQAAVAPPTPRTALRPP